MDYSNMKYEALLREEDRLRRQYNEIEDDCLKNGLSFTEFQDKAHDAAEGLYLIGKYKRLRQDPIVEYGKEWKGTTMTIDDFKSLAQSNSITDEDGYGFYATTSSKSDIQIMPSDVKENIIRGDFTHVIWFGK